jgi:hypothetical protein
MRDAASLEAYSILLHRLAADLAELRHASTNLGLVEEHLRLVAIHVDAEKRAVARLQDRAAKQRARVQEAGA